MGGKSFKESLPNPSDANNQGVTLPGLPGTGSVVAG
jgi:hypothetical protein